MIALLYGRDVTPFVEKTLFDICSAAQALGGTIQPLTIEEAMKNPILRGEVRRLYVFPFEPPARAGVDRNGESMTRFLKGLFPRVDIVNSLTTHELCWDKLATQQRLLNRGVAVPDTLFTSEPAEVLEFVREHGLAILKERRSCGGQGHLVVWLEDGRLVGDGGSHQYDLELVPNGHRSRLQGTLFEYPAPYYLQRLIRDHVRGALTAGQLLRAYVVDGQIVFWTERFREAYRRPSDFLINAAHGAKYRFVQNVSEEAKKLALRAAEVVSARIAAVDILRSLSGHHVLEVDTDGHHMMIDRQFKHIPEYRDFFNLDRHLAEVLLIEPALPERRGREEGEASTPSDGSKGRFERRPPPRPHSERRRSAPGKPVRNRGPRRSS